MCFSPEASFGMAAALVPSGIYCLSTAARKNLRLLPVAVVPLFFGIQQGFEGLVWRGLLHEDPDLTRWASLAFLFPALAVWPFWIPFMMWIKEGNPVRRHLLAALTVVSSAWFWLLYVPILMNPRELLTTQILDHSIDYQYPDVPVFKSLGASLMDLIYGLTVTVPLLLSSDRRGHVPSLVIGASAIVSLLLYRYAFVSVWCFFAAVLAFYLVWVFRNLPEQAGPSPAQWTP
jgi:hypothetical protein